MTDADEQLRHLLRDLADAGPIPEDVAARLDRTMERLVASRSSAPARSVRRLVAVGLVAASAVGVVAFGVSNLARSSLDSSASGASQVDAYASEASAVPSADVVAPTPASDAASMTQKSTPESGFGPEVTTAGTPTGATMTPGLVGGPGTMPSFSADGLAAQVQAWWADGPSLTGPATCPGPWLSGPARAVAVHLDGGPAALLVFPAQDGTQVIELYRCDQPEDQVASVSVTAP